MVKHHQIERVNQICPEYLRPELLRLARLDPKWMDFWRMDGQKYQARSKYLTWLSALAVSGADMFGLWGLATWMSDGPKIFRPTVEQCEALEQIEVRVPVEDYAQPYPALLVNLPPGRYDPFHSVLCHWIQEHEVVVQSLFSHGHLDDITTVEGMRGRDLEESLSTFAPDCVEHMEVSLKALRVAVNSCLALVNYGCMKGYLLPHEVKRDIRLADEDTERGERARERLKNDHLQFVSFARDIKLHDERPGGAHERGDGTGSEKGPHWRKGHYRMQPHGPGNSLRKRILVKPCRVRWDKFIGDASDTSTTYRG